jgi:hypothetical protein
MKSKINFVEGMPVEIPALDETGEQERARLNALALQEYEDTGTLVSEKLQEANTYFQEKAKKHILQDEAKPDQLG